MTATGYVSTTGDTRKVNRAGDTMTGELVLPDSSPDTALSAASRGYVDGLIAGINTALAALAPLAGAAFTGPVTVNGADLTVVDGQVVADSTGTAINAVDRGAATNFAAYVLRTAGVDRWAWQMVNDGTNDLLLTDSATGVPVLRVTPGATPTVTLTSSVVVDDANFSVLGTGKGYRFRPLGSRLDCEATGSDWIFSVFGGTNFDGTQRTYLRLESGTTLAHACGTWIFTDTADSGAVHTIDGSGNRLGFHGATSVAQQTVTGSRGGNAALASLLTALANVGLIVDGSAA